MVSPGVEGLVDSEASTYSSSKKVNEELVVASAVTEEDDILAADVGSM
jgi:hypothetical protein